MLSRLLRAQPSQECPTGTSGPGSPSPLLQWPPAHKDLCRSPSIHPAFHPLIRHPSIHPPVRLWRDPARPTDVSRRQAESSLTWAPLRAVQGPRRSLECCASSILVVDKVKRAGAVPSVSIMGQGCCSAVVFLWYSKGEAVSYIIREQRDRPRGGWGEEVGGGVFFLPLRQTQTHTLQPPLKFQNHQPSTGGGVLLNLRFVLRLSSKKKRFSHTGR